jgi:DNA-3-methyladenine glycosylase I
VYDDTKLFEFINLEGMQAGLSWLTILKKRDNYRKCFANFDADKISKFSPAKVEKLLLNPGIIRHKLKVNAILTNAQAYLNLKQELGSFSDYLWQFVDGKPIISAHQQYKSIPAHTALSAKLAKDLKQRGFKFIGNTICYAFMQAVGLVNDHTVDCFRYRQLGGKK